MSFSFVALVLLTILTRFFGLTWGGGFFFNPDENNMVHAIMKMSPGDLNPHFFAYGQFPLYLTFFTRSMLRLPESFEVTAYVLRFWSATFSTLSMLVFFYIAKKIANKKIATIATLLAIFTPGLIQLSHFGTTESLLILVFLINIYLSMFLLERPLDFKIYLFSALSIGIGMASKLSALIFLFPILYVSLLNFIKSKSRLKIVLFTLLNFLLILILFIGFSPYNILENRDFLSALRYETDVATGRLPVFYTSQFQGTKPYVFQIINIFPYAIPLSVYVFSMVGLLLLPFQKMDKKLGVILLSSLVYFLYFGQLYVKWTRFMSPIFFLFPLLAAILFSRLKSNTILSLLILISIFPGAYFLRLYLHPDIRVTASRWMVQNIPVGSRIFSEGGNVVDIPLDRHQFDITNFDFYSLEENPQALNILIDKLVTADYLVVPSRRVFMNQYGPQFPYSHTYYQALFGNKLGFTSVKNFSLNTDLVLDQEQAEETWSVFDRPTIRIFKKVKWLSKEEYEKVLKS